MHIIFYSILLNLALVLVGYISLGSLNTSIILSKWKKKDDIRLHNSKNAGATNSLRTYGMKFAGLVFAIDVFKTLIPTLILAAILNHVEQAYIFASKYYMSPQSLALGVIIGHIFPLYFKFKGGKGVACTIGLIASINIILFLVAATMFFIIVFASRYVSLASIVCAIILIPLSFIPWMTSGILGYWSNFINVLTINMWYVSGIIYLIAAILIITMHHSNIRRLIKHSESKLGSKEKESQNLKNDEQNLPNV
ncbi:glycerol-3-phosphate 1-O-acyltransferase PlsY [Mycoplasmopsis caviae]|uniref:Glycerol-3-phosphate acyltransferase n=1 Tax=Mycoplasmopsis caviae TaxID=55603 RepID=A0A3P8KW43_9BACT|nr:glycerol-3-phosphate 1-O-acyltransferase PlsY [Mycoplasmopsis caviae]UUD35713.1 glycerol-3-phosphate 1-O-acyltransferase PlsY [Mycoplasmopsis caviae]VDR41547.1 G3P acyltransferase [Mycoplasmopsis caviae]